MNHSTLVASSCTDVHLHCAFCGKVSHKWKGAGCEQNVSHFVCCYVNSINCHRWRIKFVVEHVLSLMEKILSIAIFGA